MINVSHTKSRTNAGFTVFVSLIVVAALLLVTASISSIAHRQVIISGLGTGSQTAFYAADTGLECALYWDLREARFLTPEEYDNNVSQEIIRCSGADITNFEHDEINSGSDSSLVTTFAIDGGEYCAEVTVTKRENGADGSVDTIIRSRGFNSCDTGSQRVERGVDARY